MRPETIAARQALEELCSTNHRTTAVGLAGLPAQLCGIPRATPQASRQGAPQSVNKTGQQVVGLYLNIQPTLTPVQISGARDRQPRSGARTLSRLRSGPLAKLKLSAIADDRPVKLTVELPAAVHRRPVAYAEALVRETGQPVSAPAKLIAPMLARFIVAIGRSQRCGTKGTYLPRRRALRAQRHQTDNAEMSYHL
jgi:hypothetical protein